MTVKQGGDWSSSESKEWIHSCAQVLPLFCPASEQARRYQLSQCCWCPTGGSRGSTEYFILMNRKPLYFPVEINGKSRWFYNVKVCLKGVAIPILFKSVVVRMNWSVQELLELVKWVKWLRNVFCTPKVAGLISAAVRVPLSKAELLQLFSVTFDQISSTL